ncbi:MAG: hypothetical protein ACOCP8_01210 [archaeon]
MSKILTVITKQYYFNVYFIKFRKDNNLYTFNKEISEDLLNIPLKQYEEIGKNCNGEVKEMGSISFLGFKTKIDAQKFIKKLEPYFLMKQLNNN